MKGMQKISRGTGFRGALNYAFNRDGVLSGRVVGGNMDGGTPRSLAAEFGRFSRLRPDIGKPVWHNSLRLPAGERLVDETWQEICDEYMRRMGFSETHPRVYVIHDDEDGQHIHIIASRIDISGSVYLGRNENLISTRHISALERDFGLKITKGADYDPKTRKVVMPEVKRPKKGELEKYLKEGKNPPRLVIQRIIKAALKGRPTMAQFLERVESSGVSVISNIASTGKFNGFSFGFERVSFRGSQLGDAFKASRLLAAINYEPLRDRSLLDARRPLPKPADEAMAPTVHDPALDSDQERRNRYKALLIDRHYQADLASRVGPPAWIKNAPDAFVIGLQDGGRLIDRGSRVSAVNMDDQAAAHRLVEIAKAKKWESVSFSGPVDFRRAAYRLAILEGLRPSPSAEDDDLVEKIRRDIAHEQAEAAKRVANAARSIDAGNGSRAANRAGGAAPQPIDNIEDFGEPTGSPHRPRSPHDAAPRGREHLESNQAPDRSKTRSSALPALLSADLEDMEKKGLRVPGGLADWRRNHVLDDARPGNEIGRRPVEESDSEIQKLESPGSGTVGADAEVNSRETPITKPK